jgi:hypothetical protein
MEHLIVSQSSLSNSILNTLSTLSGQSSLKFHSQQVINIVSSRVERERAKRECQRATDPLRGRSVSEPYLFGCGVASSSHRRLRRQASAPTPSVAATELMINRKH